MVARLAWPRIACSVARSCSLLSPQLTKREEFTDDRPADALDGLRQDEAWAEVER